MPADFVVALRNMAMLQRILGENLLRVFRNAWK